MNDDQTLKNYNTVWFHNCWPVLFKNEDQFIVLATVYEFQQRYVKTKRDIIQIVNSDNNIKYDFEIFHN